jgi:hypothetical protein
MNGVDILLGTHTYMRLIRLTLDLPGFFGGVRPERFRSTSGNRAVSNPNRGTKMVSFSAFGKDALA